MDDKHLNSTCKEGTCAEIEMFSHLDEFVQKLFVNICLDISIAQYMEDFFQYTKKNLLYSVKKNKTNKKTFHRHTRVFNK